MITYLIEVSICWLLFYSIYVLLLSKETFFNINRWYLLSTLILGLLIPLFTVEFSSLFYEEPTNSVIYLAEGVSEIAHVIDTSVEEAKAVNFSWLTLLTLGYIIGVIVAFVRFSYGFRQIYTLYKAGIIIKKGNYNLVLTQTPHLPFSFFNYLFWNEEMTLEDKDSGKIITHELAHINQWHSLDVLFLEFLGILLWFSPPIYWYKKSLRTVHEYLADAYVLRNTKKKQYGHLLIRQVQSGMQVALANNFIHSQLKQRINMMTRNKSRRKALTRYLPALPLLLLMILVFSNKNVQQNFKETKAKASLAFEDLSPNVLKALVATEDERYVDFDPIKVKQELVASYKLKYGYNFIGTIPDEIGIKKMEDSKKIKNLHQEAKRLINKYPENESDIKSLMQEVALEYGYKVRFNSDNIIYQSINKEEQVEEAELFKLLVVNGAIVGPTNSIIPSEEVQKMEVLSPTLAIARFGEANGKNGAVLIETDSWTVLESNQGETILVRKDAADTYDDGNHVVKLADAEKSTELTDTPPIFPGGEKEMLKFIYSNIKYPAEARQKGIYGNLTAQFIVEKDGRISNLKVKNDLGGGLSEEVLRIMKLVQEMPEKWTPAIQNGEAVRFTYELPFAYHLEGADGISLKKEALGVKKGRQIVIVGYYTGTKKNEIKKADGIYKEVDGVDMPKNPIMKRKSPSGEPVYRMVDKMPRFPGCGAATTYSTALKDCGDRKMLQFIYSNIKYPEIARKEGIEGTVVIRFLIEKDGTINDASILRNIGGGTGEEALRVVKLMKEQNIKWVPGIKDDQPVNFNFNLPIKFKLSNEVKAEITDQNKVKQATEKPKDLLKRGSPAENVTLQLGNQTLLLNAFPNPAKEKLSITLEGEAKNILLTVFDVTGKEYFSHKIQAFNGSYYKTIDIENAPKGTLIVNVRHKGKDYQKKIIVQ